MAPSSIESVAPGLRGVGGGGAGRSGGRGIVTIVPEGSMVVEGTAPIIGAESAQTRGALMDETTITEIEMTDVEVEQVDELLVEEVSIDGMCGVYESYDRPGHRRRRRL